MKKSTYLWMLPLLFAWPQQMTAQHPLSLPADSITIDSLLETVEKNTPYRVCLLYTSVCAEVYLLKAQAAMDAGVPASALQLCEEAISRYPDYRRINALKELKQEILRPDLTVQSPSTVYPLSLIHISFGYISAESASSIGSESDTRKVLITAMDFLKNTFSPSFLIYRVYPVNS